jgi:uncharacterized protein GlcG (DUF336 family)
MTALGLDLATRIAVAGQVAATALGRPMSIAIVDAGGHLVHFTRMDDAWLGSIDLALKKARTAALFRMPSSILGGLSQPGGPGFGIELSNDGLITFAGGLPLGDGTGHAVGAVGVSGGMMEQDQAVAEVCAEACAELSTEDETAQR